MSKQATLGGNAIDVQEPSTVDQMRGCVSKTETLDENGERKTCGDSPYLTAISDSKVRTPVCKTHARDEWIHAYDQ